MLYRVLPAMLSLALPWVPPGCTYDPDDGGHGAGGKNVGGHAGAGASTGGASMGGAGESTGGAGESTGGAGASTGGAGASTGGAGASTGGAGASTGGAGASTGGAGESTGGAGASTGGAGASTGGAGEQQGSFTLSTWWLPFQKCDPAPAQVIITNTSSVNLTWEAPPASSALSSATLSPAGSTLAPGESVNVTVNVTVNVHSKVTPDYVHVAINADIAPSQSLVLIIEVNGVWHTPLPPDIDFGEVPVNSVSTRFIMSSPTMSVTETLSSSDPVFSMQDNTARPGLPPYGWNLYFFPHVVGPYEATLTFGTQLYGADCLPNTIKARGVAVAP